MDREAQNRSAIWEYFTKKDRSIATCNTCQKDYSYRVSLSNLKKHWIHTHGKASDVTDNSNSDTSDGEQDNSSDKQKTLPTWKYFDIVDSDKFEASCKLCGKNIHYENVSDLTKHVREHNEKTKEDDDDDAFEIQEAKKSRPRRYSSLWKHFKVLDAENKMAACRICKRILSFSTISNLRRHFVRKHPESDVGDKEKDKKRVIISANGQLYEIDTGSHKVEVDDNEKDPIEMDTIYLDEMEDSMEHISTPLPTPKKKAKLSFKRNFSRVASEPVKSSINTCSDEELLKKRNYSPEKPSTMGTIDYFGQYAVSLLKELPNSVSNQLQSDFIKQIFASKVALESHSQAPKIKYTIIDQNDMNQSCQAQEVLTEPVTYTIGETNVTDNNNDAMIVESTDNIENN